MVDASSLSLELLERINSICDEFESQLKRSQSPQIKPLLDKIPAEARQYLLRELLMVETRYHRLAGQPPRVILTITAGPHQGEQFGFESHNSFVVGRAPDAQWRLLQDSYFSRHHFRIETDPPICRLIDLESTNGTHVNGNVVHDIYLEDGDQIECGETVFEVHITQPSDAGAKTIELSGDRPN